MPIADPIKRAELHKAWRARNVDRIKRKQREYYDNHAIELKTKANTRWASLTPDEKWEKNVKATYGINQEDYKKLFEAQHGLCALCENEKCPANSPTGRFMIDHNHKTGEVRGLLCNKCNMLVGWLESNNDELVRKAQAYAKCK